jgi:hypothetical protein
MNYFITSIYDMPGLFVHRKARRTFGYFDTLEKAIDVVIKNSGDIQECLYNYLVIEAIGEGIHATVNQEYWFYWENDRWTKCPKPEFLKHLVNFALG